MKVKGWVIVEKETGNIFLNTMSKPIKVNETGMRWIRGCIQIRNYSDVNYNFYADKFKVKPCTITINDKAVGK